MKNFNFKKLDKNEKRRRLFEKKEQQSETRIAKYGSDSVAVVARDVNHRLFAAFLALLFVLTSVIVGYNFTAKAVTGDTVAIDGTYVTTYTSPKAYKASGSYITTTRYYEANPIYKATITVTSGKISSVSIECDNLTGQSSPGITTGAEARAKYNWDTNIKSGINTFLNRVTSSNTGYVNATGQLIGKEATYNSVENIIQYYSNGTPYSQMADPSDYQQYVEMRDALLYNIGRAPTTPTEFVEDPEAYVIDVPELPEPVDNVINLDKTISPSGSGYKLTMDAFSTAALRNYRVLENVPTDYILVIDQSGSMATEDMPKTYKAAGNGIDLERIAQGKYYYSDGTNTYRVFPVQDYLYYQVPGEWFDTSTWQFWQGSERKYAGYFVGDLLDTMGIDRSWFSSSEDVVTDQFANRLYYKVDNHFYPLITTVGGKIGAYYLKFTYEKQDGSLETLTRSETPYYKNVLNGEIYGPDTGVFDSATYNSVNSFMNGLNWINGESNLHTYSFSEFGPARTGMYIDETFYQQKIGYNRLVYRDNSGRIQTVPTNIKVGDDYLTETIYCDSNGNAVTEDGGSTRMTYDGLLTGNEYGTRLESLDTALKIFLRSVQSDVDSYGQVDNRIAIVGFSGHNADGTDNTEILTNSGLGMSNDASNNISAYPKKHYSSYRMSSNYSANDNSGWWSFPLNYNYIGKSGTENSDYSNALLEVKDDVQSQQIKDAIDAITAYGGTQPEDGLDHAIHILEAHKNDTYVPKSGNNKGIPQERKKVVIFFTDGKPGDYSTSDQVKEANEVVKKANTIKTQYGAQVFSIGVFGESDLTPLTYPAHPTTEDGAAVRENKNYEYEDGYFKKIPGGSGYYSYLNRYWLPQYGSADDGMTADMDTIFDYMSVVSSNYPEAENFVSDNLANNRVDSTPWETMMTTERGGLNAETLDGTRNYYRLASNQESLIAAFRSAATVTQGEMVPEVGALSDDALLKDRVNLSNFDTSNATFSIRIIPGSQVDEGATISFDQSSLTREEFNQLHNESLRAYWEDEQTKETVVLEGFNFNDYYIAYGKEGEKPGYKVELTIDGLTPKTTGSNLTSNIESDSGIYSSAEEDAKLLVNFPVPSIARYKYDLNVGNDDTDATFQTVWSLVANQGVTADFNNILISDEDGNRQPYSSYSPNYVRTKTATAAIDDIDDTVYLEYITQQGKNGVVDPADYSLTTAITATNDDASSYTYYLSNDHFLYANEQTTTAQMENVTPISFLTTSNGAMYVTSVANTHVVTITEETIGEYANKERAFPIELTLKKRDGTNYHGDIPVTGDVTGTLHFDNGVLDNASKELLKLADGQSVQLTVPSNATLTVTPTDAPLYTHSVDKGPTVIDNDTTTIKVTYTRDEVTETGVSDDKAFVSVLIYTLAGMGVLVGGGAGVYLIRKKDELVE